VLYAVVAALGFSPGGGHLAASVEPAGWSAGTLSLRPDTLARVRWEADRALARPPRPVVRIVSAGEADLADPAVVASRAAFEDADDAAILVLAWRATGQPRYRAGAVARLVAWASTHAPTGNPIDESRLDALVFAYAGVGDTLSPADADAVRTWLGRMRDAKRAWPLGPRTSVNNHRTHQLKMLLLLDRALGDEAAFAEDRAAAELHVTRNLDAKTGESVDLRERGALYYHAYDLDAWLEIALVTGCCVEPVKAAWDLLADRIARDETAREFVGSVSDLDAARAKAGYGYGGAGTQFDVSRAEHADLAFHTLTRGESRHTAARVARRNLYALARYESWHH
jgi:hypothetical protein